MSSIYNWLLENTSYRIALIGAPADCAYIDDLVSSDQALHIHRDRILNFAGSTDFAGYYRFLQDDCVCMISIDSAPFHIAKKLGLPTLSVWGPTDPANYLKIAPEEGHRHITYYLRVKCSPCVHHYEKLPCGGDNFCMKNMVAMPLNFTTIISLPMRKG